MELKTRMLTRHDGKHVLCVNEPYGPDEAHGDRDALHDAAAANALMQAMRKLEPYHRGAYQILRAEAAELMREWGLEP